VDVRDVQELAPGQSSSIEDSGQVLSRVLVRLLHLLGRQIGAADTPRRSLLHLREGHNRRVVRRFLRPLGDLGLRPDLLDLVACRTDRLVEEPPKLVAQLVDRLGPPLHVAHLKVLVQRGREGDLDADEAVLVCSAMRTGPTAAMKSGPTPMCSSAYRVLVRRARSPVGRGRSNRRTSNLLGHTSPEELVRIAVALVADAVRQK
jgi:hypothetical protein